MKKKQFLAGMAAMAAVAVVSVGGTIAYLTHQTEQVTNVFSSDVNLKGKIEEIFDSDTAQKYLPGSAIQKEVWLRLTQGSADAYAALKVTVEDEDKNQIPFSEFEQKYGKIQIKDGDTTIDGFNTTDWKEVNTTGGERFFLYGTGNELTRLVAKDKDATTSHLFDAVKINSQIVEVINSKYKTTNVYEQNPDGTYQLVDSSTVQTELNKNYYEKVGENYVPIDDIAAFPKFNVVVKGYMVQADNISFDEAAQALAEEAGVTLSH